MPASTFQVVDEWANYLATSKQINSTTTTGDVFKIVLTNSAVTKAGTTKIADITACTNGGGAASITHAFTEVGAPSGVWRFSIGADVVWTATGAGFTFRYIVLYDDTSTDKAIVGYWDYGSAQAVAVGETVTLDVDANFSAYTITVS